MIIVKIYGGLAGQMLQYSLGRHLAIKNNTTLYLDLSWFDNIPDTATPRKFGLSNFNTKYKLADIKTYAILERKLNQETFFDKIVRKLRGKSVEFNYLIREKDFSSFDKSILFCRNNVVLDGYWFSYEYFDNIRSVLLEDFEVKAVDDHKNLDLLSKIKSSNSVSIHIRRGDYVSSEGANKFHGVLGLEYYLRAIDKIKAAVNNPLFFIFSDDIQWVKENLHINGEVHYVDHNGDDKNYLDIYLMRNCKHNIIANSGFSWWGAWLNNHPDKLVIGPRKWVNTEKSSFDNIPNGWEMI